MSAMKYTYAYKTSDGVRHEAAMDADSREAVFEALRAKGIKAIKVVAADGSKANGEEREEGTGKREQGSTKGKVLYASAAALFALLTLFVTFVLFVFKNNNPPEPEFLTAQTRRQVIGDMAIIEKGISTGWAEVFEHEGELLAYWEAINDKLRNLGIRLVPLENQAKE